MQTFRLPYLLLTLFCLLGASPLFAQAKPAKVKITQPPLSATVQFGQAVTFSVQHNSATPVTFQWRLNKTPLAKANGSSYTIPAVRVQDAGKYDVVVSNARGATISKAATLTVTIAPLSLPLNAVMYGDFVVRAAGETIATDGAFVVTGPSTLIDPESPEDTYTYSYTRQANNKARFVVNSRFFDSDIGAYVTSEEIYSITFTDVTPDGKLLASATIKGTLFAPPGYRPARLKFTARGTVSLE